MDKIRGNMKYILKRMMERLADVIIWPRWILFRIHSRLFGIEQALKSVSLQAAKWTGTCGEYCRWKLYRRIIKRVEDNVVISFGVILTKPSIELGNYVYIGLYSLLGSVIIGDNTLIADRVCILSGSRHHGMSRLDIPMREQPGTFRTIHIGEDCWIGSGAVVMADVGNHCVVGAGAVVTKPVEDYKIVAGNPAKVIGDRRERAGETPTT
jgi:acetyltransferase-like isoleucine patch superfamily enzyme